MYAVTDGGCRGTRGSRGKPHSLWRDAKFAPTRLRLRDVIIIYYNKPRFDIPRDHVDHRRDPETAKTCGAVEPRRTMTAGIRGTRN